MFMEEFSLTDRVAIVTGAGRELGKTMSLALAEAGANIVSVARTTEEIEQTAHEVVTMGRRSIAIRTDISKSDQVEKMVEKTLSEFHRIDILVNNSAVSTNKPLLDTTEAEWNNVLLTNLTGTFLCTKAVGKHMVTQKRGKVINISSVGGFRGISNIVPYTASKGAIISFTRGLSVEWAKFNIQVNAIAPGYFYTKLSAEALNNKKVAEALLRRIPTKRFGQPNELGPLVIYLASDASNHVTGQIICIDGGMSAF